MSCIKISKIQTFQNFINMETIKSEKYYMDVQLDFGEEYGNEGIDMTAKMFEYAISFALNALYGDMGSIIKVDVLKYRQEDRRAFLRVPTKDLVKVWSSLTLFSRYNGLECTFRVYKVTPLLCCLNLNSRLYEHEKTEDCPAVAES